ncbi:hypothetical protein [Aquamicrobium ahrensii]|uniref:Uncharacterized protein n=1 Tax=Aquamicrobium ahrensii TaxID=469551 RepID=A0ABV2KNQ7_9HYPH
MPLQNRVDPFGVIHAAPERGLFTGNRGIIHDPDTRTLLSRRWTTKAWIICECDFADRRREPMGCNGPGGRAGWTELFFLDEVTALAAGHRPCFFCRRERAKAFLSRFGEAFRIATPRAFQLDAHLHGERLASGGRPPILSGADMDALPDGVVLGVGGDCFTRREGVWFKWSFAGYIPVRFRGGEPCFLITPPTTLVVLRAGYQPFWHASASA